MVLNIGVRRYIKYSIKNIYFRILIFSLFAIGMIVFLKYNISIFLSSDFIACIFGFDYIVPYYLFLFLPNLYFLTKSDKILL